MEKNDIDKLKNKNIIVYQEIYIKKIKIYQNINVTDLNYNNFYHRRVKSAEKELR